MPILKVAMETTLTRDALYEIFGHLDDKDTIDLALATVPDIVYTAVRRIHSPRVVRVPIQYLTAFKRLERTTNILVLVKEENLDTLRSLSHLRGLCVQVKAASAKCISRLEQIFSVADRRDDQYYVFKIKTPYADWNVCYHNGHCASTNLFWRPVGFSTDDLSGIPRQYYDLLRSARPYVDGDIGGVLDITLKYRRHIVVASLLIKYIVQHVDRKRLQVLVDLHMRDFITDAGYAHETDSVEALVKSINTAANLPWHLLHHCDIPDRLVPYTKEEESFIRQYMRLGHRAQ